MSFYRSVFFLRKSERLLETETDFNDLLLSGSFLQSCFSMRVGDLWYPMYIGERMRLIDAARRVACPSYFIQTTGIKANQRKRLLSMRPFNYNQMGTLSLIEWHGARVIRDGNLRCLFLAVSLVLGEIKWQPVICRLCHIAQSL